MTAVIAIGALTVLVACLPLVATRLRAPALNPASLVLLVVAWSPLAKSVAIAARARDAAPLLPGGTSIGSFLSSGAALALAAMVAYSTGYLMFGHRTSGLTGLVGERVRSPGRRGTRTIVLLTSIAAGSFIAYLLGSGTEILSLPLSAKRFLPGDIGVASRFGYLPYYLFKVAMLSGSIAYAAAYVLFRSPSERDDRVHRALFAGVFLFALLLAHFASLRLFILIVLIEVGLLAVYLRERRRLPLVGGLAAVTILSFLAISAFYRPPVEVRGGPGSRAERGPLENPARASRFADGAFGGRYFMDVGKLSYLMAHFPDEHRYALGLGYLGPLAPTVTRRAVPGGMSSYVAREVLGEPLNSVPPGYAGELYLNFGWAGIVIGFLLLGVFHRAIFDLLMAPDTPAALGACLVLLIPSSTLLLLNSGLLAAASRATLDIGTFLLVVRPVRRRARAAAR